MLIAKDSIRGKKYNLTWNSHFENGNSEVLYSSIILQVVGKMGPEGGNNVIDYKQLSSLEY